VSQKLKIVLLLVVLAIAGGGVGVWFWRKGVVEKHSKVALELIQASVAAGDFVSARSALAGLADPAVKTAKEHEIRTAELKHALSIRDMSLMRVAIGEDGESWIDPALVEAAELEQARDGLQTRDFETYQRLADKWKAKATLTGQWTLLEADQLLAKQLRDDALKLLKSATFTKKEDDALRYSRLALLDAKEPWKAMESIDAGLKVDPRNADLLSFRGQIEEAAGRTADARLDYVAAVLSERKNPIHRENLANFYIRMGDRSAAAETWRDAAEDTGLGVYALKAWFWAKVSGVRLSKPIPPCRQQGWNELITAIIAAPEDVFWNSDLEAALAKVPGLKRPELTWLRLLEAIRENNTENALNALDKGFPREAERLMPDLSLRLLVHLTARAGKDPRLAFTGREKMAAVSPEAHPFLIAFSQWANNTTAGDEGMRFQAWLAAPTAPVGTFISIGWAGAATILGNGDKLVIDKDAPDWFDYGYAKCLHQTKGKETARKWLEALPARTPAAELFLGELQLATGAVDQGLASLQKVSGSTSPQASRAQWTLAFAELDRGNTAKAREIVAASATLAESVQGKEILARAALAEGKKDETVKIYTELGDKSPDAMIFLSKEAFAVKDYAQARKWTALLTRRFPEQPSFRENLLKIDEAEKNAKP
jgi:tetratricopeptide (TPR) repeat protein